MYFSKNRIYQLFFYTLLLLMLIFNGGNYDLYALFNFIFISIFFLICQRDLNFKAHIKKFFLNNRKILIFYFIFLFYLIFQTIPLQSEFLKFFSYTKYKLLLDLNYENKFSSISLNSSQSFLIFLNYFSLILYLIVFKSIFYKERHIFNFYFYLSLISFIASIVAVYFYLIGNPNFLFINNDNYPDSATGFFINRTVFSCFLIFGFLSSLEYLNLINIKNKNNVFFLKIYVRLFLLFITIGIITSFSRLGNFLFLVLILVYLIKFFFEKDNNNKFLFYTLLIIIFFDIFIVGFYFGGTQIIDRFSFIKSELSNYTINYNDIISISRGEIARFSTIQLKNFLFFGYGAGGFETLFKNFYNNLNIGYANHAHFDLIEFMGEFGLVGFTFVLVVCIYSLKKIKFTNFKNIYLFAFFFLILFFDFSLHIPIIQILLLLLFSIKENKVIH